MIRKPKFWGSLLVLFMATACSGTDNSAPESSTTSTHSSTPASTVVSTTTTTSTTTVVVDTTVASTTIAPPQDPLPNPDLFDAAIKLHTIDSKSRDVSAAVIFDGQVIHTFAAFTKACE